MTARRVPPAVPTGRDRVLQLAAMRKGRTLFFGGLTGAVIGLVMAPRTGESRREALVRLQATVRRRGGLSAFAGTPCSGEDAATAAGPSPRSGDGGGEGS